MKTAKKLPKSSSMGKHTWPMVKLVHHRNGTNAWQVDTRLKGRGERLYYKTKTEATTAAEQARVKRQNEGREAFSMSPAERTDAQAALEMLRPNGRTLREAAAFLVKHLSIVKRELTVSELIAELLTSKKGDGKSDRYLKDLRNRLGAFADAFPGIFVTEVSAVAVDDWLRGLQVSGVTRNNFRRVLIVLFNYGLARGYCLNNPVKSTAKAKEVDRPPGILTAQESAKLLECASADVLPALALGLFAGLRPESEVWKLRWEHIDFDSRLIDVGADRSKTAQQRYVVVADNLVAWLHPHRQSEGLVCALKGDTYFDRLSAARKAAGIKHWPSDALRHTYASMHYAKYKNAGETSEQMGHADLKMLFRHYRARVKPADAETFWNLRPAASTDS